MTGQASALRALNRLDEALAALNDALARFPDDPAMMIDRGWILLERNEVEQALPLWRRAVMMAGDRPESHVGLATTLRQRLRFAESDAVLTAAMARFPTSCFVFANHAVNADMRGDRAEALSRWQVVSERFPFEPISYAGPGAALKALGRFDEADALLAQGMQRFPDDANVAINHAWVAVAAMDWPEAIRRWTALRAKWPNDTRIKDGLSEATMHSRLAAADGAVGIIPSSGVEPGGVSGDPEDADLSGLMLCFESIGENCELGFVQRHFEAEPLGLFRWAGIAYVQLLEALDDELGGIGADENTTLDVNPNNREYFTADRRYGMNLHSFIVEGNAEAATVKMKLCRRITYLKEKLLADLRNDTKIFVFSAAQPLLDEELRRLHASLCRYRPVSLLHVAPHADLPPGAVREIDTRLWRGSLGRTGYNGRIWDIEFGSWLTICRTIKHLNAAYVQTVAA